MFLRPSGMVLTHSFPFVGQMWSLTIYMDSHFVAIETRFCQDNNNHVIYSKSDSTKMQVRVKCPPCHDTVNFFAHLSLLGMNKGAGEKRKITTFPSMLRRRACL